MQMMRILNRLFMACILVLAVFRQSRGQDVFSFYPLFSESEAVLIPEVEGSWETGEISPDTITFRKTGDNFYLVSLNLQGLSSHYEGAFTRVGDHLMLDLLPVKPEGVGDSYYRLHLLQIHSCIRARLEKDRLYLGLLKYRWFYDNVIAKNTTKEYLFSENRLILTLPTHELRTFLAEHINESGFLEDDVAFRRIGPLQASRRKEDRPLLKNAQQTRSEIASDTSQWGCVPGFPYKDGWLGGDGGFSVPIGPSKTLWFFGDTFVGRKDQKTRAGSTMVTTIGISTCQPDKTMDMQYYWRNMYTDHPEAFFQSHTDRYRYWQLDAFIYKNSLYVVMGKVGPKPGASPDDIFDFSYVGMTLARVTDPNGLPPEQWKVELIPWSDALDAEAYDGGLVEDGKYLYMFMLKDRWKNYLVRLPLECLESAAGHLEYFSRDGTWQPGSYSADAKTLFDDQLGGSVLYHAPSKRWLMVYGPHFGGTAIYFRTASEISGPWSDRKILYECPELIKGMPLYEEDNYCYCSRVHAQFFSEDSSKLLVTYCCNSKKLSKLIANMAVNVPQVLVIPVPE